MTDQEKVELVIQKTLPEVQIEYLISQLSKNKSRHTLEELSQMYLDVKHTFHVLMCRMGQMQTYEHILDMYRSYVV